MNNQKVVSEKKTTEFRIFTSAILREAVECSTEGVMLKIPMQTLGRLLAKVAKRAIELDDEELNKLMLMLGLYECCNPLSPNYNPNFVEDYLEHGKMSCNKRRKEKEQ